VGLGSIGSRHAEVARGLLPGLRIAAWRHRLAPAHPPVDLCVATLDDALAFQPDAAVIANPASHRLTAALPLASADVHLLLEKPMATHSDAAVELVARCNRQPVLMVGYNLRFLPSLQQFRRLIHDGCIGRVLSVRAETGQYLPSWRPSADYRETVSAQQALGGGPFLELSHEIDYLRWIFGRVHWVSAMARRHSSLEIDVDDSAYLLLGFSALDQPGPIASLTLDFIRHDTTRRCSAIGDSGTLRWDAVAGAVDLLPAGATAWERLFTDSSGMAQTYIDEWRSFLSAIASRAAPAVSGTDGLAVLRVIDAARRSAETNAAATQVLP